ncbi:MAG: DUF4041 domain-containing protein [Thermoguttaceae bacterium]|jgi:hypothetical protein
MFTTFLFLLLIASIIGLGFLGYFAFYLYTKAVQLETQLVAHRTQYEQENKKWNEYSGNLKNKCQAIINKYNEDAKRWNEYSKALKAENDRLAKWQNVANAEAKAEEMLRDSQSALDKAKTEANILISSAQQTASNLLAEADQKSSTQLTTANDTAKSVITDAKEQTKKLRDEVQFVLNSATTQAAIIIDAANKKAEEIAGNAYEALKNADLYEQTVKAMKNRIDGYGDQYIIPEQSLLDDLAEDFGHTQAGQELKCAREVSRVMIRNGTAATCDYVEANRRETAINFVVDAFNGKVDTILSRVRHDNAGTLGQKIQDAFNLVNYNGKAFRDARITETYLASRLDELKWATLVQQFVLQEREEQRSEKERIRDDARAAKERERALRDATKEEETLLKGIELGRQQAENATEEQKTMYEKRLQEMAERLREVQEQKERARSMAEQVKKGHVYIISNIGSFGENVYKIGLTRRWDPMERVRELGDSSVPFEFDVHATILHDNAPDLEYNLHKHFELNQVNKVNHRKEFFRASLKEIREEIEKLGITTGIHWTMTAEAKEYYESQKIEEKIKSDPSERERWLNRQYRLERIATDLMEHTEDENEE